MQVRNDYHISQGASYQQSHLRQGTEADGHVFEEEQRAAREREEARNKTGEVSTTSLRENAVKRQNLITDSVEVIWSQDAAYAGKKEASEGKTQTGGFLKKIWDSLGDEKAAAGKPQTEEEKVTVDAESRIVTQSGMKAVIWAIRQRFSDYVTDKWENLRERVKVSIYTALKRFGAGQGAFGALADKEGQEALKQGKGQPGYRSKGENGQQGVPVGVKRENHLMDSYTKNGEYCRLGENLTYRKNAPKRETEDAGEKAGGMEKMS